MNFTDNETALINTSIIVFGIFVALIGFCLFDTLKERLDRKKLDKMRLEREKSDKIESKEDAVIYEKILAAAYRAIREIKECDEKIKAPCPFQVIPHGFIAVFIIHCYNPFVANWVIINASEIMSINEIEGKPERTKLIIKNWNKEIRVTQEPSEILKAVAEAIYKKD